MSNKNTLIQYDGSQLRLFSPEQLDPRIRNTPELAHSYFRGLQFDSDKQFIQYGFQLEQLDCLARSSATVQACEFAVESAVFWTFWRIDPANDYEAHPEYESVDKRNIELINNFFDSLGYQSFTATIKDIWRSAYRLGFSVAEKIWVPQKSGWRLLAIKTHPSYEFQPVTDWYNNLESIFHYPSGLYFNPRKFIYAVWPRVVGGNWLGQGMVESIVRELRVIDELTKQRASNAALSALRVLLHYYDSVGRSADEIARVNKLIDEAQSGSIVHIPAQTDLAGQTFIEQDHIVTFEDRSGSKAFDDIARIIEDSKKDIKRLYGIGDDLGQVTLPSGSYARAKVGFDLFLAHVNNSREWIAEIVNRQIIPDILAFNRAYAGGIGDPLYRPPKFTWPELDEDVMARQTEAITQQISAGIIKADEPWIRAQLGIPEVAEKKSEN